MAELFHIAYKIIFLFPGYLAPIFGLVLGAFSVSLILEKINPQRNIAIADISDTQMTNK